MMATSLPYSDKKVASYRRHRARRDSCRLSFPSHRPLELDCIIRVTDHGEPTEAVWNHLGDLKGQRARRGHLTVSEGDCGQRSVCTLWPHVHCSLATLYIRSCSNLSLIRLGRERERERAKVDHLLGVCAPPLSLVQALSTALPSYKRVQLNGIGRNVSRRRARFVVYPISTLRRRRGSM